jgi:hypothetical protein
MVGSSRPMLGCSLGYMLRCIVALRCSGRSPLRCEVTRVRISGARAAAKRGAAWHRGMNPWWVAEYWVHVSGDVTMAGGAMCPSLFG